MIILYTATKIVMAHLTFTNEKKKCKEYHRFEGDVNHKGNFAERE
jgi:hypothetical protein